MATQARTPTLRTVDISEWSDIERADIEAEYAVDGAPYGESLRTAWYATEAEARTHAAALVEMTQDTLYSTSWGDQPAWMDGFRITRYVAQAPLGEDGELDTPTHSVTAFGRTIYAPTATPLANMFGSARVQVLTAPVSASPEASPQSSVDAFAAQAHEEMKTWTTYAGMARGQYARQGA